MTELTQNLHQFNLEFAKMSLRYGLVIPATTRAKLAEQLQELITQAVEQDKINDALQAQLSAAIAEL